MPGMSIPGIAIPGIFIPFIPEDSDEPDFYALGAPAASTS